MGVWRTVPRMCHVLAFSMLLGMQFWVSFVAGEYVIYALISISSRVPFMCEVSHVIYTTPLGVVMYTNLPRHTFGYIQSKLFPKYFQISTVLITIVVGTFVWEHAKWEWKTMLQVSTHQRVHLPW